MPTTFCKIHPTERIHGSCRICYEALKKEANKAYRRKRHAANPEPKRERDRKRRAANPGATREQVRKRYAANPEPGREYARRRLDAQGGRCPGCKRTPEETSEGVLYVDHRHYGGRGWRVDPRLIRDLLCNECNKLVGAIERNRSLVKWAEQYTDEHEARLRPLLECSPESSFRMGQAGAHEDKEK